MNFFDYDGHRIYFEEHGNGTPLLLLHGNTASGRMFGPIVPLVAKKRRVVVMDFLGCGRSERLAGWPADLWYWWSEQAYRLCVYRGYEKINVIGCSGGALAAINLALEHPGIVNAFIADSFEGVHADKNITQQIRSGRELAKKNDAFRSMLRSTHGDDWETVFDADTDAVIRHASEIGSFFHKPLSELRVRMLLTGSTADDMFPDGHYTKLFADICRETDMAQAHIFEHGSHPAMLSNIEEFAALCEKFFGWEL